MGNSLAVLSFLRSPLSRAEKVRNLSGLKPLIVEPIAGKLSTECPLFPRAGVTEC